MRIDEIIIDSLQVWARLFTARPRLEFRSDEHGRVFCDVLPAIDGIGDMKTRHTPVTTTRVQ